MTCANCHRPAQARGLCRNHYQQAWKKGQLPEVSMKRPPASYICPDDHKHDGSSTCYIVHKCRCDKCRDHLAARARNRERLKAYGRWVDPYVSAEPVREHIAFLRRSGMGAMRISELSGVSKTAIHQLIYGRQAGDGDPRKNQPLKRVLAEKANKILAVRPDLDSLREGAYIDARGAKRRVQALVVQGWSLSKIGAHVGISAENMTTFLKTERCTVARHKRICEAFEALWDKTPPHESWHDKAAYNRARNMGRSRGWVSPLGWDDIDADEQPPKPEEPVGMDESAVDLAVSGVRVRLSVEEREEAVRMLVGMKLNDSQIAERLHVEPRTVLRIRGRLGLAAVMGSNREIAA